jgi:prophage tail gpP-like protein
MTERFVDAGLVELRFDGKRYAWWQSISIRETVDDLCASVQLAVTLPGTGEPLGTTANTVFEVWVADELVTTVRADIFIRTVDKDSHTINFQARSLARELVDCQYSITLAGLKLGEVVKRLCSTFKVPVKISAETAVVPNFSMQCELPANALINAARAANLLLYPLPDGGLLLTEPTSAEPVATLTYGVDIKRYSIVDEYKLRFSEYRVKSFDYDNHSALKGDAVDAGIEFFRPMHIVADRHSQSLGGCGRRAELERNRRQARAHRIELEVQGWRHAAGRWQKNTQVRVVIPDEGIDRAFMVGEVSYHLDDKGGRVTRLQVMDRAAFIGEAKKKAKRGAGTRKRVSK